MSLAEISSHRHGPPHQKGVPSTRTCKNTSRERAHSPYTTQYIMCVYYVHLYACFCACICVYIRAENSVRRMYTLRDASTKVELDFNFLFCRTRIFHIIYTPLGLITHIPLYRQYTYIVRTCIYIYIYIYQLFQFIIYGDGKFVFSCGRSIEHARLNVVTNTHRYVEACIRYIHYLSFVFCGDGKKEKYLGMEHDSVYARCPIVLYFYCLFHVTRFRIIYNIILLCFNATLPQQNGRTNAP